MVPGELRCDLPALPEYIAQISEGKALCTPPCATSDERAKQRRVVNDSLFSSSRYLVQDIIDIVDGHHTFRYRGSSLHNFVNGTREVAC